MIHTPLCPRNCEVDHHDIVNTLQALAPRFSSVKATIFSPLRATRGNNKEDFKKQVHMLLASGWQKDEDVPEPSENLRLPLLLLSSMFGKFEAMEWLINEEHFDVSLRSSWTNETALHLVCRHLYVALSPSGSRLENMTITEKVANFEKVAALLIEKDVSLFWAKDGLNKETPFHILARHLVNASLDDVGGAEETEDLCLSYYSKSFDALLKLLQAEGSARLNKRDFINILCAKNGDGDTVMHILAKDFRRGFQFLKYLVKSILCSSSYLRIKNTNGVTAMDIVTECNPYHLKDLQTDSDSEQAGEGKQPTFNGPKSPAPENTSMNVLQFIETEASSAVTLCGEPGSVDSRKDVRCAIHTKGFPAVSLIQEPVSSSVSPLLTVDTAAVGGLESPGGAGHLMADQHRLAQVMHSCSSLSRPQAEVHSIQLQEQGSHASSQSAYLQSGQHLPVIFIKQEPLEVQHESTCIFARQHSYPQNSVTIKTSDGSTFSNATPAQCVALDIAARKRSSTEGKTISLSTATKEVQTKIKMPQQQQWKAASEVLQTSQDMHEVLRQEKRKKKDSTIPVPTSRQRLTVLPLDDLTDTNYKIDSWHTPLCHSDCTIKHHPLVLTLCATTNRRNCKGFRLLEMSKINFLKCLKAHLDQGWKKDQEVPDDADFLRYPLVYLACIFFKYLSLELLTMHGFNPNIKLKGTNDYPLHVFLRHLYDQGSKLFKSFPFSGYRQFMKMFGLVSSGMHIREFLSLQGGNGDTLLHVGAKMLVKKLETETAVETPDSTQGCVSNGNSQQPNLTPAVCKLREITEKCPNWALFYGQIINILLDELYRGCLKNRVLDASQAEPVLNTRNHAGETFLDILCEQHHVSSDCIAAVLSKFPLAALIESVKLAVPRSCWSDCIPGKCDNAMKKGSLVTGEANLTPLPLPVESSLPHVDRHTTPVSTLTADGPSDTVSPAPPSQVSVAGTDSLLDSLLTPVITTPGHMSLKPNTKRKIIEALKEEYTERLDLAITRCSEVEADFRKKKESTCKLTEELEKKDEEMKKLEREVQQLKKDIWVENQALSALQNSWDQFKKEEIELKKSLTVLGEADPEPPSKRSKTQEADMEDSRL